MERTDAFDTNGLSPDDTEYMQKYSEYNSKYTIVLTGKRRCRPAHCQLQLAQLLQNVLQGGKSQSLSTTTPQTRSNL